MFPIDRFVTLVPKVRQLERVLKEMHEEDLLARADEQERATGKRPKKNSHFWKPFDFQVHPKGPSFSTPLSQRHNPQEKGSLCSYS